MIKKVLACILLFLCFSGFFPVDAQTSNAKYEIPQATEGQISEALGRIVPLRFLPGHPLYFLIIVKENFSSFFQPSSAKVAQFQSVLASKRLKETYLLIIAGKNSEAFSNLERYQATNQKIIDTLQKAIGQNQEVTPLAMEIAEGLKNQEVLFYGILNSDGGFKGNDEERIKFDNSVESFAHVVMTINNIKPGIKDRFKTVLGGQLEKEQVQNEASGSSTPESGLFESTPNVKPKRIIY